MRRPIALFTAVLCIVILITTSFQSEYIDALTEYENESITLQGRVLKVTEKDEGSYRYVLTDVTYVSNRKVIPYKKRVLVQCYESQEDLRKLQWERIRVTGSLKKPEGRSNPKLFDYRRYLSTQEIHHILTEESHERREGAPFILSKVRNLKLHTCRILRERLSEESYGLYMGMAFADTEYMDDDIMTVFRRGGTAHVLAVSGLHLGIVYAFLSRLRRRKRSLCFDGCILLFLIAYILMTGMGASVMRAFLMIVIHMTAVHLNRRYDFFSSSCLAMDIILILKPMQLYATGFQLSFLAVFTLAVLIPLVSRKWKGILMPSLVLQMGIIPYTAYTFNYISLLSIFANIPVLFLSGIIIPLSVMLFPLAYVPALSDIAAAALEILLKALIIFNDFTYMDGLFVFDMTSPPIFLLVLYYLLLFFLTSELGQILILRRNRKRITAAVLIAILCSACIHIFTINPFLDDSFVFVDVGQGDCLHVRSGSDNILIDGGGSESYSIGEKVLKPYLLKNKVKSLDLVIATHLHMDHFQGLCELSQVYSIDRLAVFEGNRVNEAELKRKFRCREIVYLKKGDILRFTDDSYIRVLSPHGTELSESDNENDNSLVLQVVSDGISVLMTGDIDSSGEDSLTGDIKSMVLKSSHHGSRYSSSDSFLDRLSAKIAVIQVGKRNTYGHPHQETLKKYGERGMKVYRTDEDGAIGIEKGRKGIVIDTVNDS